MRQGKIAFFDYQRQVTDVFDIPIAELLYRPLIGGGSVWVEVGGVNLTNSCPVMIADGAYTGSLADDSQTLTRVRAVADNVSQAPYIIGPSAVLNIIQYCGQGC